MEEFENSGLMPFRPCAMMLKVNPSTRIKARSLDEDILLKIKDHLDVDIRLFDPDLKPGIAIGGKISSPIKADAHISVVSLGGEPAALFELGFTIQQVLLYLAYLRLSYVFHFGGRTAVVPLSRSEPISDGTPFPQDYAATSLPDVNDLLYFKTWGNFPDLFFQDNPKLDSVIRYARYAPRISGYGGMKFIMDEEHIHLMIENGGKQPADADYVNAGVILLNFLFSAEMLNLKGEWKLLRGMDAPDKKAFGIPEGVFHFATWHGQLF
jgi:hypothetical protein